MYTLWPQPLCTTLRSNDLPPSPRAYSLLRLDISCRVLLLVLTCTNVTMSPFSEVSELQFSLGGPKAPAIYASPHRMPSPYTGQGLMATPAPPHLLSLDNDHT